MTALGPEAPDDVPRDVSRLASDKAFDLGYALRKNRWGAGALALGIAALLIAIIVQPGIWQAPDWRYVAPPAALAVLAGMAVRSVKCATLVAIVRGRCRDSGESRYGSTRL